MKYVKYEIYTAPSKPTEYGKYYGSTPILEQAQTAVKHLFERGSGGFIKGVCADGTKHYI